MKFEVGDMIKYNTLSSLNNNPPRIGIIVSVDDNRSRSIHPYTYEVYWILDQITSTYYYSELVKVS